MWLVALVLASAAAVCSMSCDEARMLCAYRAGCGAALSNYMLLCEEVLTKPAPAAACPKPCEHALIALTSTVEGKELLRCRCEDDYCVETKQRIEVCRPQVMRGAVNETSSCGLSQLICLADAQCAVALGYYHRLCRAMYQGKRCSNKCLNSIEILKKQEKAAALSSCQCDGYEDYDCPRMQSNLERLCFHKNKNNHNAKPNKHHQKPTKNDIADSSAMSLQVSKENLIVLILLLFTLYS